MLGATSLDLTGRPDRANIQEQSSDSGLYSLSPVKVLLVDDHQMLLDALVSRLGVDPRIAVTGVASNADDLVAACQTQCPDVVFLDINLPGRGTFAAAEDLMETGLHTRLVFLSGHLADVYLAHALRVGAKGYILKDEPASFLCDAAVAVMQEQHVFSAAVLNRLDYDPVTGSYRCKEEHDLAQLNGRQLEVLRHLAMGCSVKEIAANMSLTAKSVDSHKYRIMNKLGIHDRVELTRYAIREGLSLP